MENKEQKPNNAQEPALRQNHVTSSSLSRLDLGNAWMWCAECGAKLWDFDGYEDQSRRCPYKKNTDGSCSGEVR